MYVRMHELHLWKVCQIQIKRFSLTKICAWCGFQLPSVALLWQAIAMCKGESLDVLNLGVFGATTQNKSCKWRKEKFTPETTTVWNSDVLWLCLRYSRKSSKANISQNRCNIKFSRETNFASKSDVCEKLPLLKSQAVQMKKWQLENAGALCCTPCQLSKILMEDRGNISFIQSPRSDCIVCQPKWPKSQGAELWAIKAFDSFLSGNRPCRNGCFFTLRYSIPSMFQTASLKTYLCKKDCCLKFNFA